MYVRRRMAAVNRCDESTPPNPRFDYRSIVIDMIELEMKKKLKKYIYIIIIRLKSKKII